MKQIIKKYQYFIFATVGIVVVLWQLLLPGYIIMLDWSIGPHFELSFDSLSSIVNIPSDFVLFLLHLIMPMWLVQKIILVGIIFILFYFPLKFYPFIKKNGVEYFASLFFVFNPFVYERMLAGQWRVVVGYAFLFPLIYFIWKLFQRQSWRIVINIFLVLYIAGMWSVHFLAIGILLVVFSFLMILGIYLKKREYNKIRESGKKFLLIGFLFIVLSSYWLIPYIIKSDITLSYFTFENWKAFATAEDSQVGVIGNVLVLRGFWVENHSWVKQFVMSNERFSFYFGFVIIFLLSFVGMIKLWKDKTKRIGVKFLVAIFVLSLIFAMGISAYGFWQINKWLLEHIWFWGGFRDSQKWSGVNALLYALFSSVGVGVIAEYLKSKSKWKYGIVLVGLFYIPFMITPKIIFGFSGQLQPVWYPDSWNKVNDILKKTGGEKKCKAIFLPWHQYYSVAFNDGILSANLANNYFDCKTISGYNTELEGVATIANQIDDYFIIENAVTNNDESFENVNRVTEQFSENGIDYIIVAHDLKDGDIYKYPFLNSLKLKILFKNDEISLYALKNR